MKKNVTVFIVFVLVFLKSCTVTQEIHFHKDFSGKYKFTYDFTEYIKVLGEDERIKTDSLMIAPEDYQEYLNNLQINLSSIKGISKIKINNDADAGILSFSFDFANLESLNKSLKYTSLYNINDIDFEPPYFEIKKRSLYFIRKPVVLPDINDANTNSDLSTNILKISFDKKPVEIIIPDKDVKISRDGKEITEKGDIENISVKNAEWEFKFSIWAYLFNF